MANDPRDDYRDAMQRYEQARATVAKVVSVIKTAANGLEYHLPTFLAANYQLTSPNIEQHRLREVHCDMKSWPDRDELARLLTVWHDAFNAVRGAWTQVPHEDRAVSKPPPTEMTLR